MIRIITVKRKKHLEWCEKSQHDLIEAAKLHNIIENDPLKSVGGGYK